MKNIKSYIMLAVAAIAMASCASSQSALNDLRNLNADLRDNRSRFTARDWKAVESRMNNIQGRIKRYNYSDEELREIGSLTAGCYVYMGKNTVGTVLDDVRRTVKQVEGAAEEIKRAITNH